MWTCTKDLHRWIRGRRLAPTAVVLATLAGCGTEPHLSPADPSALPAGLDHGAERYDALCSGCHGVRAAGTQQGPPLVHDLYVRSHHRDSAFRRAINQGVEAHHWPFGNMPPVAGVSTEDAEEIINYIRALQSAAGIY